LSPRLALALALFATACNAPPQPAAEGAAVDGSTIVARVTERADADLVGAVQRRLLSEPGLPGRVGQHGWAGPGLYIIAIDGDCASNEVLVKAMTETLGAQGATEVRCVVASSAKPGEPAAMPVPA
jgi:hypothetical protein